MEEYEIKHFNALRRIAPECTVLLKKDGSFPLSSAGKIALYGSGARHTKKGGTGSGDVNVRSFTSIEEALLKAGFEITTSLWLDAYDIQLKKAEEQHFAALQKRIEKGGLPELLSSMGEPTPEPEYDIPLLEDATACQSVSKPTCETAIYVLSRQCGEGTDRKKEPGDFLLTETEKRDILQLCDLYSRFMLVLNVGGVLDLSPVVDKVPNLLLLSQLGMVTGEGFVDLLLGKSYPSGKLTATWARYEDYPNVGTYRDLRDTYYKEGILVGYRWFDTKGKAPIFPFGFGLGYTSFSVDFLSSKTVDNNVYVDVEVTNTGKTAGRECVQLYIKKPQGKLSKAAKDLMTYKKTGELLPGQKERLTLTFNLSLATSFDETTNCFVLEKGAYTVLIGTSSRDVLPVTVVEIQQDVVTNSTGLIGQKEEFSASVESTVISLSDEELVSVCIGKHDQGAQSVIGNASFAVAGAAGETTEKLVAHGLRSLVFADGPAGIRIAKTYIEDENGTHSVDNEGIDRLRRLLPPSLELLIGDSNKYCGEIKHHYASAIPIGTALAQSFNPTVQRLCGDLVAEEMEYFGIDIWLAPAVNIQRDVLCGRNFEYYSEDPVISGFTASAVISGVQAHKGKGVALKHFCCNNQETNRFRSNSVVGSRALRELYLRAFEIAVKTAHPTCIMSSYNLLNGTHTAERPDLLQTILREEWGFEGIVVSDWVVEGIETNTDGNMHKKQSAVLAIAAGNDLIMPGSIADFSKVLQALQNGTLPREKLLLSAKRIIRLINYCYFGQ